MNTNFKQKVFVGSMCEKIAIQQVRTSRDVNGAEVVVWEDLMNVWAKVEEYFGGSDEKFLGDQQMIQRRTRFTIRYTDALNEKMRIVFQDDIYDINVIKEIGRRQYLEVQTELRK